MSLPNEHRQKQIRVRVFDNEPEVRLAEQRLRQAGIPCLSRALHGGPGLWGTAYNLPHGLYVYESDEMRAREVLDLVPMELIEREREHTTPDAGSSVRSNFMGSWVLWAVFAFLVGWIVLFGALRLLRQFT